MLWLLLFSQQIYITSQLVINAPVLSCQDKLQYQPHNYIKLSINSSVSLLIGGTIRNSTQHKALLTTARLFCWRIISRLLST